MGPGAGLHVCGMSPPPGFAAQTVHPVASGLYRLSHPGSKEVCVKIQYCVKGKVIPITGPVWPTGWVEV